MADPSSKSSKDKPKKNRTLLYTALGAGVVVAGGAAYLWFTRRPAVDALPPEEAVAPPGTQAPKPAPPAPRGGFPLKKGSRGALVAALQAMLNTRFNASLGTPDGIWGGKTEAAVEKAGLPNVIDEATYAALVGAAPAPGRPTASDIVENWTGTPLELATKAANGIAYWVNARDFQGVMTFVHAMRSVSDYSAVNSVFRTLETANRTGARARRTIVNALLGDDMAWAGTQKRLFTQELLRMGLKYNPSTDKWALSGASGHHPVRSAVPATTWDAAGNQGRVPPGAYLGTAVNTCGGVTQVFTPDRRTIFVQTQALSAAIL